MRWHRARSPSLLQHVLHGPGEGRGEREEVLFQVADGPNPLPSPLAFPRQDLDRVTLAPPVIIPKRQKLDRVTYTPPLPSVDRRTDKSEDILVPSLVQRTWSVKCKFNFSFLNHFYDYFPTRRIHSKPVHVSVFWCVCVEISSAVETYLLLCGSYLLRSGEPR